MNYFIYLNSVFSFLFPTAFLENLENVPVFLFHFVDHSSIISQCNIVSSVHFTETRDKLLEVITYCVLVLTSRYSYHCCECRDYRPMPALDRYETDVLDDEEYDNISQTERAAAEAAMRRRDREEGILTRRDDLELIYGMHCIILA